MRGCALLAATAICGCGRLGFDPPAGDGASSGGDAPGGGSDMGGSDGSMMIDANVMIDAMPAACADAIEVEADMAKRSSTCLGFDRINGCGPDGTEEAVFRWVVPASGTYIVSAIDVASDVIHSTGRVDATCTATTSCTGVSAMPYTAGQIVYFALEAPQGGCVTYDFLIDTN